MEERIQKLMKSLDISREEALEVIADDDDIDKGKPKDFDLTKEQEKVAKAMKNVKSHEKTERKTANRPEDTEKIAIIQALYDFLSQNVYENVKITNKTKLISFSVGDDSYELDLKRKRKAKN